MIGALKATINKQDSDTSSPSAEEQELNNLLKNWHPENQLERMPCFFLSGSKQMSVVLPKEEEVKKYKGKTIRRRADGRWWTRFYNKEGKQISVYGKTQNECLSRLKEALRQNNCPKKEEKPITLGDWLTKWLELYKVGKVRQTTVDKIKGFFKGFAPLLNRPLAQITAIDLQKFFNEITYPRKREQMYCSLKDAFTKAVKNKIIAENPFDIVEIKRERRKPSKALTVEQERQFVQACQNDICGKLFLVCLYQGLRIGEALALEVNDIDFANKTMSITKAVNARKEITDPKTETSKRIMPLFQRTVEVLPKKKSGRYFDKFVRGTYQHHMKLICDRLGIANISIHSLRHTFATRCAEAGIAAKVVQKWLGHSTVNMTLNVYTHINDEFEQKAIRQFDTYFDTHKE